MKKLHRWETIVTEGLVKIIAPNPELFKRSDGIYEPAWAPIFYNPRASFNRDVAIVFALTVFGGKSFFFVEPLAGTGVRSVRYVVESGGEGIANDIDPISYMYILRNIVINGIEQKLRAFNNDANILLNALRTEGIVVNLIDVDPYGTPIPFIDSAARAACRGGYIACTATDTGPLNCSHPNVCLRRYGASCVKADFSKEMGLRILVGAIVRRAASLDIGLEPILCYYHDYYYRAYFKVWRSARKADEILNNIGYIAYNPATLERMMIRADEVWRYSGKGYVIAGPLWIGYLANIDFLKTLAHRAEKLSSEYTHLARAVTFLRGLIEEYTINHVYYRYDKLFGLFKIQQPPIGRFIEGLRDLGYKAARTHFDPRGVKTNAPYTVIVDAVKGG